MSPSPKQRNAKRTSREEVALQKTRESFMKDDAIYSRTVKALLLIGHKCLLLILNQNCFQLTCIGEMCVFLNQHSIIYR